MLGQSMGRHSRSVVSAIDLWFGLPESIVLLQSDPVAAGAGFHIIGFEFRSSESVETAPTSSYAQISWSGFTNQTELDAGSDESLFADVGWFALSNGTSRIEGEAFASGYLAAGDSNLVVEVTFAGSFDVAPHMFAGYQATNSAEGGHCRLVEASPTGAAIALEYDSCDVVAAVGARTVGWMALASTTGNVEDTRVHQQPTDPSDVAALLAMAPDLRLPGYLRWRTGSDPCRDRWEGLECRVDGGQAPRVVMVDIVSIALAFLCHSL